MAARRTAYYLHYTALGLLLAVLFLLQSSNGLLPRIFSVAAVPVVPAVICIALFEGETAGACFGLAAGILMDAFSARAYGFHAIFLLILGCLCGLLVRHLLAENLLTALMLCAGGALVYHTAYFFIFYLLRGLGDSGYYFFRFTLPAALYTFLFVFPIYYLVRAAARRSRRA